MRKFNIENIKSLILISLLVTTVFQAAYKFDLFEDFLFPKGSPYPYVLSLEEGLENTLQPSQIIVRFSGQRSTKILSSKQRFYNEIKTLIRESLLSAKTGLPTSEEEFQQVKSLKSLQLHYLSLNGKLLSRSFFLEKSVLDEFKSVQEIVIPLSSHDFFYFKTENQPYKAKMNVPASVPFIDNLENSNYLNYQSLHSLFDVQSFALVPTGTFNLRFENYDTISAVDRSRAAEIASQIFGEKYDFTTRISETDGAEIYSYNYGQQVLKIQPSGLIQYTNEDISLRDISLEEATHIALNFLSKSHFDWNHLYLTEAKEIEHDGNKGHLLRFAETIKELPILNSSDTSSVHIILLGDKVYSYSALLRSTLPYDLSRESRLLDPLEVLNLSFNTILKNKFEVSNSNQLFDKISKIELIYYMDDEYILTPCWKMNIEGKSYLFNAYTGEIEPYGLV